MLPARPPRVVRGAQLFLAVFAANAALAWIGYSDAFRLSGVAVVWPPSGFMLAALVLTPRRDWPIALTAGFLANLIVDLNEQAPLSRALAGSAANLLEAAVVSLVLIRLTGSHISLTTVKQAVALAVGAAMISNAVTAVAGALVLVLGWSTPFWRGWFVWWVGDGLGMLLVAPVVLVWHAVMRRPIRAHWKPLAETFTLLVLLAFITQVLMGAVPDHQTFRLDPYIILPLLVGIAVRCGLQGSVLATLVVAGITLWNAAHGHGPFADPSLSVANRVLEIYVYLAVLALSALFASAVMHERRVAETEVLHQATRATLSAESRDQLAAILHAAADFVTIGTPEGPPAYLNPAIRAALGIGPDEHVESLLPFRPPGFLEFLESTIVPSALTAGSWSGETEYVARGGARIPVLQTSVVHRGPDGRLAFISTIAHDISARRRMEDVLRQSQKMEAVGQLAGGIAHDFNNLLTAILGYADLLVDEPLPTDEQRTAAVEIRAASLRAASLTRQLLAFGRQQVLQPRVTRLSRVVAELLPMLRRLLGEHIDIRDLSAEADRPIFADVTQLEQIVLNLAINSGDAMEQGGTLGIRTGTVDLSEPLDASHLEVPPGRYAFLEVIDSGHGMDEDTRRRLFDPFFTTKPTGRGTGLGLATVYGIVKQMRGGIWVYSEPGRGTTFRVYFPVLRGGQGVSAPDPVAPAAVVGGTETLLLVEDEPGVRNFARRMLERYGYRVLVAANPAEARTIAEAGDEIALVLTDIRMPGGNGPELVEALRRTRPGLPALFMSGYSDLPEAAGTSPDPSHFLPKPFAGADLAAKVRAILDEDTEQPAGA